MYVRVPQSPLPIGSLGSLGKNGLDLSSDPVLRRLSEKYHTYDTSIDEALEQTNKRELVMLENRKAQIMYLFF